MVKSKPTTIIIPVYADWASLKDCIESLLRVVDFQKHKLLIVNDCGPEADSLEAKIMNIVAGQKNIQYFRNTRNLGFGRTCNRAVMELDKSDNDVLLLNSDTIVTEDFLDELSSVLGSKKNIGAVSPRSNNATIATVPVSAAKQKGIDSSESYKIHQAIKDQLPAYSQAPVAHGFCMLIRRTVIRRYGLFDEVFGKGYGEEVDFCLRIKKHGYESGLANRAFVYHLEARSFTLEAKTKLLDNNNKIIWQRYPSYRRMVQEYMNEALKEEQALGVKDYSNQNDLKRKRRLRTFSLVRRLIPRLVNVIQRRTKV